MRQKAELEQILLDKLSALSGKPITEILEIMEKSDIADKKNLALALGIERTRFYREVIKPLHK
jgi:hypothetical protein